MNKNIKFAIYFLLGIVLFYLMFNGNGVEGFGDGVEFIYVKVTTVDSPGTFERFVKVTDSQEIDTITELVDIETQAYQTEYSRIISNGNPTYYKSGDNLFGI